MKNILIFGLSFIIVGVIGRNEASSFFSEGLLILVLLSSPIVLYFVYTYLIYYLSIYYSIDQMINELSELRIRNEKNIESLRESILDMKYRLNHIDEINPEVKKTIEDNIQVWESQVSIFNKVIDICEKKISSLSKNREEIEILEYMISKIRKEPDSKQKIDKLEELIGQINKDLNPKISKKLKYLMKEAKIDDRDGKIVNLKERLLKIEKDAS